MRSDPENLLSLVERVSRWLVCKRWKKVIYGAISVQKRESSANNRYTLVLVVWLGPSSECDVAGIAYLMQCNARIEVKSILALEHCIKHAPPASIIFCTRALVTATCVFKLQWPGRYGIELTMLWSSSDVPECILRYTNTDQGIYIHDCVHVYMYSRYIWGAVHIHIKCKSENLIVLPSCFSSCRYRGLMQLGKLRNRTPALAELGEVDRHTKLQAIILWHCIIVILYITYELYSWYVEARQADLGQESVRFRNSHGSTSQQNKGTVQRLHNISSYEFKKWGHWRFCA